MVAARMANLLWGSNQHIGINEDVLARTSSITQTDAAKLFGVSRASMNGRPKENFVGTGEVSRRQASRPGGDLALPFALFGVSRINHSFETFNTRGPLRRNSPSVTGG